jgi:hypothetical protein
MFVKRLFNIGFNAMTGEFEDICLPLVLLILPCLTSALHCATNAVSIAGRRFSPLSAHRG